ncbi:hypothetical protein Pcinc_032087 [Petrolisthes cinctipes]|uniref:UPAR/Ly6 domain-containing protein n=1 Tax=Petrolisthes cinctipes TaxID=88211 RepID=A0AAE1EV83_PETCI|nr:hypothetical protein Pcinc_032087 [Petrolisthes cinctipes]
MTSVWNITHIMLLILITTLCQQGWGLECVQCEGVGEEEECTKIPPAPKTCPDTMSYCITIKTSIPGPEDTSLLRSMVRSCAPGDMGTDCETGKTDQGEVIEVCHDTCDYDGCNDASRLNPNKHVSILLLLLVVVCVLWMPVPITQAL